MKKYILFYVLVISNILFAQNSPFKGFLPPRMTTLQRNAIPSPAPGLMIFNTTTSCMENWNNTIWVSKCSPAPGAVLTLNCSGATHNGTLTSNTAASGVSSVISYTGGNGGTHSGQTVSSTGVTGLTATVASGSFANGNGSLTYTITGTPTSSGTASFAINIGGKNCTITRSVASGVPVVPAPNLSLNCTGTLLPWIDFPDTKIINIKGVSTTVAYTGIWYPQSSSPSSCGVPGIATSNLFRIDPAGNSLQLNFSPSVTNVKVYLYNMNRGEQVNFRFYTGAAGGAVVATRLGGSCNSRFTVGQSNTTSAYVRSNSNSTTINDAIALNFGGAWMHRMEITPIGTSELVMAVCIGDAAQ